MKNFITYEFTKEDYSVITLNRKEKRNAINISMAKELKRAIHRAREDEGKFLLLRSSAGDVFCAGGDLKDFHSNLKEEEVFPQLYMMKEVLAELLSLPLPTICLLSGDAYGGGCELATACDLRIAKEGTKFGFVQTELGILPGWGGGTLLYERVHPSFAFYWLSQGKVYSSKELAKEGWIHKLVDEEDWDEQALLKPFINKSKEQLYSLKAQYNEKISSLSLVAKMNEEVRQCSALWGSKKHRESIDKILNKRK